MTMMDDPARPDSPLADDTDAMAEVTRAHAEQEDLDQRTPEGSHSFPAADHEHQPEQHLGQGGVSQSDDISGQAPAAGMARQKANPARRD